MTFVFGDVKALMRQFHWSLRDENLIGIGIGEKGRRTEDKEFAIKDHKEIR